MCQPQVSYMPLVYNTCIAAKNPLFLFVSNYHELIQLVPRRIQRYYLLIWTTRRMKCPQHRQLTRQGPSAHNPQAVLLRLRARHPQQVAGRASPTHLHPATRAAHLHRSGRAKRQEARCGTCVAHPSAHRYHESPRR